MDPSQLLDVFHKHQHAFSQLCRELVTMESVSGSVEDINRLGSFLGSLFASLVDTQEKFPSAAGDILSMKINPSLPDKIVLLAHMDTAAIDTSIEVREEDGRLFGHGVYDMKSGIALYYFSLMILREMSITPERQIQLLVTCDEETGSRFSRPVILEECRRASAVILAEPSGPEGAVKTSRKGFLRWECQLKGKSAHSGIEPGAGIDANRALAQLIVHVDRRLQDFPGLEFNPGRIEGGSAINTVPGTSTLIAGFRSWDNRQLQRIVHELTGLEEIAGARVSSTFDRLHPALEETAANMKLYRKARDLMAGLNYPLPRCGSGGASDGSTLSSGGIPVLDGLGMKGAGAHSGSEFIELEDFPFRASLITSLCGEI